jgi:hypothetical protein
MLRVISEIEPARGGASAEILKRHLDALGEPYEYIGPGHPGLALPRWPQRLFNLTRRAFPRWASGFEHSGLTRCRYRRLRKAHLEPADLVLALAHGPLGMLAGTYARGERLPLVTFFHDWWPEMIREYAAMTPAAYARIDAQFADLQRASHDCLCVCEGMAEALLPEARRTVLLPVPDRAVAARPEAERPPGAPLRVVYTGSLWGVYGELMRALAEVLRGHPAIALEIYGNRKYLDPEFLAWAEPAGVLRPFLPYEDYLAKISAGADVLVGVMGLGEADSRRMQTSFPSKVANYFRTGNAVLLWADRRSSLGRFADSRRYPWWEPEARAEAVVERLLALARDPGQLAVARARGAALGQHEFDPDRLQTVFADALARARGRAILPEGGR